MNSTAEYLKKMKGKGRANITLGPLTGKDANYATIGSHRRNQKLNVLGISEIHT